MFSYDLARGWFISGVIAIVLVAQEQLYWIGEPMKKRVSDQKGQSLVEVALFFPIFVLLLAGLVEVSQLVITQNRISSAARSGARFAANGGEDVGITNTVLRTVTQTLELEEDHWDIFAIRAQVNGSGNAFSQWQFAHIYGISNTQAALTVDEIEIQTAVLDELQTDENDTNNNALAADLEIVGTYVIYDSESILGLTDFAPVGDLYSISDISVMRSNADQIQNTDGCITFPVTINGDIRSVTAPGSGSTPYPSASAFDYPASPPVYASFTAHSPNISLSDAAEGDLFLVESGANELRWLVWNEGVQNTNATLRNSLLWPGNVLDYSAHGDGGVVLPGFGTVVRGYVEPGDATDLTIHEGDRINLSTGSLGNGPVATVMQGHVDKERQLRLVVWATLSGTQIVVEQFAVVRVVGYSTSPEWLLVEFMRWDTSCGQSVAGN